MAVFLSDILRQLNPKEILKLKFSYQAMIKEKNLLPQMVNIDILYYGITSG